MVMNRDVVVLSSEQFDQLVELLTPGYELAKAYLEQSKAQTAAAAEQTDDDKPKGFRKSAPPPDFDDASKQGSG